MKKERLKKLCEYIGLEKMPDSWVNCYDNSIKYFADNSVNKNTIKEALEFYFLDNNTDYNNKIFECVDLINSDRNLSEIFFLIYYILFIDSDENYKDIWNIKYNENIFKSHGSSFIPIIVLLNAFNIHKENMNRCNFDLEQINYHKNIIKHVCIDDVFNRHLKGIRFSQMLCGSYFINIRIIQVGRLQYELSRFDEKYQIYRNSKNNDIKLKTESNDDILICKPEDYCIKIHIPTGDKLLIDNVKNSIESSKKYILKYFKDKIKQDYIYCCKSWLLSRQLINILNKDSNILKFQKLFYSLAQIEDKSDFINFIFNESNCSDYTKLPENTYLQRKIKEKLLQNTKLYIGFGVLKYDREF